MTKIISIKQLSKTIKLLKSQNKKTVLAGGCFDILHLGHITFLEKARSKGDYLILLLESDQKIKQQKGNDRPINDQKTRAKILSLIQVVDLIIMLPLLDADSDYDQLITKLSPDIIAITKDDPQLLHKKRQAKLTNAKLIEVVARIKNQSTSRLAKLVGF